MLHEIAGPKLDRLTQTIPADASPVMLNLLRFRPDGGRDLYFDRYIPAFRSVAAALGIVGIAPLWTGNVAGFVAGPADEAWDAALLVRYPSLTAFRAIVESDAYRATAAPIREAALCDWRLIAQNEMVRA
ncbi:hypothetical protein [Sphingomonas sp.]|uniref:hypothetical protein n=1 Tax=Sphingomonas sp. TaxID=28214 RepID=UPI003B3B68DF